MKKQPFYVVLTEPGPNQEFVECETPDGKSITVGGMRKRADGHWVLGPFVEVERHVHVGPDDACAECGLDIRDNVHMDATEALAASRADAKNSPGGKG